jgi:hypothetical protein
MGINLKIYTLIEYDILYVYVLKKIETLKLKVLKFEKKEQNRATCSLGYL